MATNKRNSNNNNSNSIKNKKTKKVVDLDKTNSYDLVFDDDRMKDSESLDVSFIDGKKKKAPKIDMTEYKYEDDVLEYSQKKKGETFSIILIIILSFVLGCLFFYILVRDDLNSVSEKVKIQTETKVVMDDNYVFVGDSIISNYDLEKYYTNMNVVNSGVLGNGTVDILENISDRIYQYNPSKVFLMIGTNDIKNQVNVDDISLNIERIVNLIKQNRPYAEIYLLSVSPINSSDDDKIELSIVDGRDNEDIKKLNELVNKLCDEKDLVYVDLYNKLVDDNNELNIDYTVDGVHISEDGYKIITEEIMKYIKE